MPTLALSMIVRDAEKWLPECLESVRGAVDEVVIADTGSADSSIEIAQSFGAQVVLHTWEDDYAKARNASLAAVRSDWVLVMDADERLDASASKVLRPLLRADDVLGYQVTLRNYFRSFVNRLWDRSTLPNNSGPDFAREFPLYGDHENVRLFRRIPEIFFEGCIHESVLRAMTHVGAMPARSNLVIHHLGLSFDMENMARKYIRYRELGRKKLREMPDDAQAHLELGLEESQHFGDHAGALKLYERACELEPRMVEAWLFRSQVLLRLGRFAEAAECAERAERMGSSTVMAPEVAGDAHYNLGHIEMARECYRRAVAIDSRSADLRSKLGLAEVRMGRGPSGLRHLREAISREPASNTVSDRLVAANVLLGRCEQAAEVAEHRLASPVGLAPEHYLRAASLRLKSGNSARAQELVQQGLAAFPDSGKLLEVSREMNPRLQPSESPVSAAPECDNRHIEPTGQPDLSAVAR
jgi:tetratricopeptide (TPR) repeat protein